MTFSGRVTRSARTVNQSSRQGAKIRTIVLHHMASTNLEGTLAMWTNATRVGSANYAIGNEGQIIGVVPEEYRSWSLGSTTDGGRGAAFDRHSITFEIENAALGGGWPISSAAQEATAQVVADICRRYDIQCNRTNILGHREVYSRYQASYSTACPGGLDMDWIVQRASELLGVDVTAVASDGVITIDPEVGWNASSHTTTEIQQLVGLTGGDVDGIYGAKTTEAVKAWQRLHGLDDDGIFGPLSEAAGFNGPAVGPAGRTAPRFPLPANSYFGPKAGPVQSVSGYFSHRADLREWQQQMIARGWLFPKSGADGLYGSETRENAIAFQREKGLIQDGLIGPVTWSKAWTEPVT